MKKTIISLFLCINTLALYATSDEEMARQLAAEFAQEESVHQHNAQETEKLSQLKDILNLAGDVPSNTIESIIMPCIKQARNACGGHAILNHYAIEQLLKKNKAITADNINEIVDNLRDTIPKPGEMLLEDEVIDFAKEIGASTPFMLSIASDKSVVPVISDETPIETITNFLESIKKPSSKAIGNFVVNVGFHWILVSVVKEPYKNPIIRFFDSNAPGFNPSKNSNQYRAIRSVYNMIKAVNKEAEEQEEKDLKKALEQSALEAPAKSTPATTRPTKPTLFTPLIKGISGHFETPPTRAPRRPSISTPINQDID